MYNFDVKRRRKTEAAGSEDSEKQAWGVVPLRNLAGIPCGPMVTQSCLQLLVFFHTIELRSQSTCNWWLAPPPLTPFVASSKPCIGHVHCCPSSLVYHRLVSHRLFHSFAGLLFPYRFLHFTEPLWPTNTACLAVDPFSSVALSCLQKQPALLVTRASSAWVTSTKNTLFVTWWCLMYCVEQVVPGSLVSYSPCWKFVKPLRCCFQRLVFLSPRPATS